MNAAADVAVAVAVTATVAVVVAAGGAVIAYFEEGS
jgi:hypothetical protein